MKTSIRITADMTLLALQSNLQWHGFGIPRYKAIRGKIMNRTFSLVTIGFLVSSICLAEGPTLPSKNAVPAALSTVASDWHGYQKHSFTLAGHSAFVVVPKVAAPGNPWIWRTSFPDFHSEVDQELVYNGYHIGFIDVVSMLGSDSALDIMEQFYDQAQAQWGLAEKPAL